MIWLNRQGKAQAIVAHQSTSQWSCIVRSGNRCGLRVCLVDAEAVHRLHKPMSPFLDSHAIEMYHGGPMPFGATRETLSRLFATWKWPARPLQPRHKSSCGQGMVWDIQATSPPAFEVWQCEHSDVLITKAPKKESRSHAVVPDLQASARTLKALEEKKPQQTIDEDPWLYQDPWAAGNKAKVARSSYEPIRPEQIDQIVKQVEQRVQASLLQHFDMSKEEGDEDMEDQRVTQMEERLAQLEMTVHAQHTQQTLRNQEINGKIGTLHQQVEQQQSTLQNHFDCKMAEQLRHIERLLTANQTPQQHLG